MSKQTRKPPSQNLPQNDAVLLTKMPMSSDIISKYFRRSPQQQISSPLSSAKVVDDDCLVIDGIAVEPKPSGSGGSSFSGSGASGPRGGSKFQFAREEEDISPVSFPVKWKPEALARNSYAAGTPFYGPKYNILPQAFAEATGPATQARTSSRRSGAAHVLSSCVQSECYPKNTSSASKLDSSVKIPNSAIPKQFAKLDSTARKSDYWSPLDDGIEVFLPSQPGLRPWRDDVDAYINSVLYGPTTRKRLPCFSELCPS